MHNDRLMEVMCWQGFTAKALAQAVGVSVWTIRNYMYNGQSPRDEKTVRRIAEVLCVAPEQIFPERKQRIPSPRASGRANAHSAEEHENISGNTKADLIRRANVRVGQRLHRVTRDKYGTTRKAVTVVECGPRWFRVQYDAHGYSECFSYHSKIYENDLRPIQTQKQRREA